MKKLNATFGIILLMLGCSAFSSAANAQPPIVGLWDVQLFLDPGHTQLFAETYKQWHGDRLEFESANLAPGAVCVGTWRPIGSSMVSLYHVGWTPGGVPGFPTAVRFVETETDTVSPDRNSYNGTGDQTFYDVDGNALATVTLYITATRLTVQ
jgi:hypothetical protein